jgi:hypothetical protein
MRQAVWTILAGGSEVVGYKVCVDRDRRGRPGAGGGDDLRSGIGGVPSRPHPRDAGHPHPVDRREPGLIDMAPQR